MYIFIILTNYIGFCLATITVAQFLRPLPLARYLLNVNYVNYVTLDLNLHSKSGLECLLVS